MAGFSFGASPFGQQQPSVAPGVGGAAGANGMMPALPAPAAAPAAAPGGANWMIPLINQQLQQQAHATQRQQNSTDAALHGRHLGMSGGEGGNSTDPWGNNPFMPNNLITGQPNTGAFHPIPPVPQAPQSISGLSPLTAHLINPANLPQPPSPLLAANQPYRPSPLY